MPITTSLYQDGHALLCPSCAGILFFGKLLSEAESLYLQARQIDLRSLGEDHPDLAVNLVNLAGLYVKQGRYAEAEPLYLKAINTFQQRLGSEHPYTTGALELTVRVIQFNYSELAASLL